MWAWQDSVKQLAEISNVIWECFVKKKSGTYLEKKSALFSLRILIQFLKLFLIQFMMGLLASVLLKPCVLSFFENHFGKWWQHQKGLTTSKALAHYFLWNSFRMFVKFSKEFRSKDLRFLQNLAAILIEAIPVKVSRFLTKFLDFL